LSLVFDSISIVIFASSHHCNPRKRWTAHICLKISRKIMVNCLLGLTI
jgi:hypothetical protein